MGVRVDGQVRPHVSFLRCHMVCRCHAVAKLPRPKAIQTDASATRRLAAPERNWPTRAASRHSVPPLPEQDPSPGVMAIHTPQTTNPIPKIVSMKGTNGAGFRYWGYSGVPNVGDSAGGSGFSTKPQRGQSVAPGKTVSFWHFGQRCTALPVRSNVDVTGGRGKKRPQGAHARGRPC